VAASVRLFTLLGLSTGKCFARLNAPGSVNDVQFSPDGKRIVSGSSNNNSIQVWESGSGKLLTSINARYGVLQVRFAPNGKSIAANLAGTIAVLWDPLSLQPVGALPVDFRNERLTEINFSPEGDSLVISAADKEGKSRTLTRTVAEMKTTEILKELQEWSKTAPNPPK
jgi:WD40 repeat protein